jgi:hypothetical protein
MLVKLLATLAMAAATWLFWRLIARITAGPAKPVARPRPAEPDPTITMIQDPETGAWRAEDRDG